MSLREVQAVHTAATALERQGILLPDLRLADHYAVHLAHRGLNLVQAPGVEPRPDGVATDGSRYRIAGRHGDRPEAVRMPGIPRCVYDRVLLVRFGPGYGLRFAVWCGIRSFLRAASYRPSANEWILPTEADLWSDPAMQDVTEALRPVGSPRPARAAPPSMPVTLSI